MSAWHVYVLCEEGAEETGPFKVGTARNVKYRVDSLRGGNPRKLIVLYWRAFDDQRSAFAAETTVQRALSAQRFPARDWFSGPAASAIAILEGLQ